MCLKFVEDFLDNDLSLVSEKAWRRKNTILVNGEYV